MPLASSLASWISRRPLERPLIGVTTSEVRRAETVSPTPEGEPPHLEMALGLRYLRAIEQAGGLPVVMPPLHSDAIEPLLDRLSAVCLSGGPDLNPKAYGARPSPQLGPTEPTLDRFELAIARGADEREMPILAICRGMQALNVVRGGTLEQHLPGRPGTLAHRQAEPGDQPSHGVQVTPGSYLCRVLGASEAAVNSFHHQAIERLGRGLVAVAWAPDGIVEGIEDPERPFLIGIQWHAELLAERSIERALFKRFVHAARDEGGAVRSEKVA